MERNYKEQDERFEAIINEEDAQYQVDEETTESTGTNMARNHR